MFNLQSFIEPMNSDSNIRLLNEEFQLLKKSLFHLSGSVERCKTIGFEKVYSFDELESFDSLTGRFARSADIYTQKVLRTIFILLREDKGFFADRVIKAENEGIIKKAEQLLQIKDLRNDIVHQYIPEATIDLVRDVLNLSTSLIENIQSTERFMSNRNWLIP